VLLNPYSLNKYRGNFTFALSAHKDILDLKSVIQSDSKLLSGFLWPINGNPDNNLNSLCSSETFRTKKGVEEGEELKNK
jgi:hypothetical protein